jgi:APA family basic amino acid/polyamine antiporter
LRSASGQEVSQQQLRTTLRFWDITLLIISSIIGSGIFFVPSVVLHELHGKGGLSLLAWVSGGVLSLLGALTLAELSASRPAAGGIYVFIRECFGALPAFLYGWTLFFVISSGTIAALAVAFADNIQHLVTMPPALSKATSIILIAFLCVINVCGTKLSATVQNMVASIKIASVLVISALILASPHRIPAPHPPTTILANWSVVSSFGLAVISILWAYEGWQYATYSAGEAVNPQKDFPPAFFWGTVTVIFIYVLMNVAYTSALGTGGIEMSRNVATDSVTVTAGPRVARFVTLAIAISVLGGANGVLLTNPRVFYAMSADGLFLDVLARVHPRFGTPALAIVAGSIWAGLLAITGTFQQLLTFVVFTGWLFYALSAMCVFVYRKRAPHLPRPYRVTGYPFTPLLFVAAAAALACNSIARQPLRSLAGLFIVGTGIPAYLFWQRSRRQMSTVCRAPHL